MEGTALNFVHRFEPGRAPGEAPLLLLHGTGGDESDLLPVGRAVGSGRTLLSPRGKVLENGMPRFFRRLAEGVFDEADLARRTDELADFIGAARDAYGLAAPVALGFSNGANIAAAMMLLRPEVLAGAILLRAMVPLSAPQAARLPGTPILLLSGAADPIVPATNAARLAAMLEAAGGVVEHRTLAVGHGLTQEDLALGQGWLERALPDVTACSAARGPAAGGRR